MDSSNKVFKFQGNGMIVHAKGPNVTKNINLSSSFQTNLMSSTMNMPRNFGKNSYAESLASQRSLYYRATSPTASIRSDYQPRNFYQSYYHGGSQRSTYNGRGGSPVSMRSIDSSTSVDIIRLIKNGNFNKHEWRSIWLALNRKTNHNLIFSKKKKRRQEIERYYNKMKNFSGDDSGEQGSNSSLSSDDCASTRTGYSAVHTYNRNYKENVPRSITSSELSSMDKVYRKDAMGNNIEATGRTDMRNPYNRGAELYHSNYMSFQKGSQNNMSDMLKSQTHNFPVSGERHTVSGVKNMFASQRSHIGYGNASSTRRNAFNASMCSTKSLQSTTLTSQKERFQSGFQFPSQRFNNSIIPFEENVKGRKVQNITKVSVSNHSNKVISNGDDSDENNDIFLDTTSTLQPVPVENGSRQKRNIESLGNVPSSANKKCKTSDTTKDKQKKQTNNNNEKKDFEFAKPQFPVRKFVYTKPCEEIISKSAEPFSDFFLSEQEKNNPHELAVEPSQDKEVELEVSESTQLTNSDLSMRPSFIKRKLFTQTLDVTERKNASSESLPTDSPQSNIYSALSREKHRTRKLVTSQSLLSRDIYQDDNNLLDLIHKIVPPSQVNTSKIAAKSSKISGNKNTENGDDKWDITSVISTCNDDRVSDTYTDDEIFKVSQDDKKNKTKNKTNKSQSKSDDKNRSNKKSKITKAQNIIVKKCNVVISKLVTPEVAEIKPAAKACATQKPVLTNSRIEAFWSTDVESDYENAGTPIMNKMKNVTGTQNASITPKQSSIKSYIEIRPNVAVKTITNTRKLSPLADNKTDATLIKTLKKQKNKQILTTLDKKTNKSSNKTSQLDKSEKTKKPATVLKTRRQINLSTVTESVEKIRPKKKVISPTKTINHDGQHCKQSKDKNKEKVIKTQIQSEQRNPPRSKEQIDINYKQGEQRVKENQEGNPKNQRQLKKTKIQNNVESPKNDIMFKVLRSRYIDLSSSFNSDQFELTGISRVRKSRTPSKRISFNKSKNAFVNLNRKEPKLKHQR